MILFVFEGKKREPDIFRTMEYLFFPKDQTIICSFGNNIYELYRQLKEMDGAGDIVSLLREKNINNPLSPFAPNVRTSDFSEIFLFFDYDFQNRNLKLEEMNTQISEMLNLFCDETDNGKLYINYPMIESIRYTKNLPDSHYHEYTISRAACQKNGFKSIAQTFSSYGSLDFAVLDLRSTPQEGKIEKVRQNWYWLEEQNTIKANYICNHSLTIPSEKDSISQKTIFNAQLSQFVLPKDEVAILSAFPLFNFDYFKQESPRKSD